MTQEKEIDTKPIRAVIRIREIIREGETYILDAEINGERGPYVLTADDNNGYAAQIRTAMEVALAEGRLKVKES